LKLRNFLQEKKHSGSVPAIGTECLYNIRRGFEPTNEAFSIQNQNYAFALLKVLICLAKLLLFQFFESYLSLPDVLEHLTYIPSPSLCIAKTGYAMGMR